MCLSTYQGGKSRCTQYIGEGLRQPCSGEGLWHVDRQPYWLEDPDATSFPRIPSTFANAHSQPRSNPRDFTNPGANGDRDKGKEYAQVNIAGVLPHGVLYAVVGVRLNS